MSDRLVSATAAGGTVRAMTAVTTALVEESRLRHSTLPTATAALGRTLTAGCLLGATLKTDERLSIQVTGDGPLRGILVSANGRGEARGFVTCPRTELPLRDGKLDVGRAVGRGLLVVMRIPPWGKEPYRSILPLVSGEIGQDIAHYLATSEQVPSAVGLGVYIHRSGGVGAAGGYLVQTLPGVSSVTVGRLERNVSRTGSVTTLLRQDLGPEEIIARLFSDLPWEVVGGLPLRFRCQCSRDRFTRTITALGADEIRSILREEGFAEGTCDFCNEHYRLEAEELQALLASAH